VPILFNTWTINRAWLFQRPERSLLRKVDIGRSLFSMGKAIDPDQGFASMKSPFVTGAMLLLWLGPMRRVTWSVLGLCWDQPSPRGTCEVLPNQSSRRALLWVYHRLSAQQQ
jgi:hypothetical protein